VRQLVIKVLIQHNSVEVYSTCRRNYWGSSRPVADHTFCIRQILEKCRKGKRI